MDSGPLRWGYTCTPAVQCILMAEAGSCSLAWNLRNIVFVVPREHSLWERPVLRVPISGDRWCPASGLPTDRALSTNSAGKTD